DAWASGHMWERWGSPDRADFPSMTEALMVAITSGLIHGARAVLEDPNLLTQVPFGSFVAAQLITFDFDDPLNAPGPEIGFRSPGDAVPHAGLGDLYLNNLLVQQGASRHPLLRQRGGRQGDARARAQARRGRRRGPGRRHPRGRRATHDGRRQAR